MLRDKILFVIKRQNLKKQVSFCHPSLRNEHIKMWETHPNDYWVFSKMVVPHFSRWRLSQISYPGKVQDVKFPTCEHFTESNSRGLPTPSSLLGQTIDRCIILFVVGDLNNYIADYHFKMKHQQSTWTL